MLIPRFYLFSVMDGEYVGFSVFNERLKPEEIVSKFQQVEIMIHMFLSPKHPTCFTFLINPTT